MSSSRNLASKYRPRRVDALVGQEEVKSQMRQLLARKTLPTALLFAGPSGCGKTTAARIFGSTVNCATRDACGKCESCKMSMTDPPTHPDIHEHDSTTARGIDEVRAFLGQARFAPAYNGRIFIIDEVHAFTADAKRALLKLTEEPPANTVFCLCTTEAHSLPVPLIGRCTRLNFTSINPSDMSKHLIHIARKEGLDFADLKSKGKSKEDSAVAAKKLIRTVVELSEGRMRDAVFILESIINMHRDGKFPTIRALMEAYLQKFDLSADHAAIKCLYSVYSGKIKTAISTVYDMQDNPRGLLHAARWLNDKMLCDALGQQVKFPGYGFKKLNELLNERKVTAELPAILRAQAALNNAEWRMNSSSVPPHMILSECVAGIFLPAKKA